MLHRTKNSTIRPIVQARLRDSGTSSPQRRQPHGTWKGIASGGVERGGNRAETIALGVHVPMQRVIPYLRGMYLWLKAGIVLHHSPLRRL